MSEFTKRLVDPRFAELMVGMEDRLARIAVDAIPSSFSSLLDSVMVDFIQDGFSRAAAHEGTVWLMDSAEEYLVPVFNTGPNATVMTEQFKQPLDSGLICMVFSSQQPFVENEVFKNSGQSRMLDELLNVRTHSLMAVPFSFLGECRGVLSCVQLGDDAGENETPKGFLPEHLARLQKTATVLSRLVDLKLLGATIGWDPE